MITTHVCRCAFVPLWILSACSERPTGPANSAPIESLAISGVRINEADFRANGRFELGLVASDAEGAPILQTRVGIAATLEPTVGGGGAGGAGYAVTHDQTVAIMANSDVRAAILIDNSLSMTESDPRVVRADAAKLFWETMLPASTGNQVAILDYGVSFTTGMRETRILQPWTNSASALSAVLPSIRVGPRGTPLYESVIETSTWISTTTSSDQNRVILLLTDGEPTGSATRLSAINAAKAAGVTIHGVGLGPASDKSAAAKPAAVAAVREVAEQTGGVYAAATDAIALAPIFKILATVSSRGQLIGRFRISPVPPTGTSVRGTVSVTAGGRAQSASFSFRAP